MLKASNIINFSGGKDSTAMLLLMLDRNEPIHSVVFFDTGWEFPEMYEHIDRVEKQTGIKIVRLYPRLPFDFMLSAMVVNKGKPNQHFGYGWAKHNKRWCTTEKTNAINHYSNRVINPCNCIGFAVDEQKRNINGIAYRYPLREYQYTEAMALELCKQRGYTWSGLYDIFNRVSCFCCPLKPIDSWRKLRKFKPELWAEMLRKDRTIPEESRCLFNHKNTPTNLEKRFAEEDRQMTIEWDRA